MQSRVMIDTVRKSETDSVKYVFDSVFPPESRLSDLYRAVGVPAATKFAIAGISTAILTFGQSGSGKTKSLFGGKSGQGLIFFVLEEIFTRITVKSVKMTVSAVGIYQNQTVDLLNSKGESRDSGLNLHTAVKLTVKSVGHCQEVLNEY